ncbi:MAG: AAA family ATPase [Anaerolineae bacterium]|nr:AAA family ATPase [Anaerolineae bacterium]
MTDRQRIEQALAAIQSRKQTFDPAVVETSIEALQHRLTHLQTSKVSRSAMKGERRHVTVMFADISGFTAMSEKLDPEEVRGMINGCFELLGDVIDRYGGHIDKFIGDEIMALFGAPVAHENDPERALRAALDMMVALEEFNRLHADKIPKPLALHFGINSGLVIAGGIGTSQRQDYSVMGDTVNLAARLEDLSESGEILVGEATYRLTEPLFEFDPLQPVKVKGKAQPVHVYRLLKARAILGGQLRGIEGLNSPLVGRVEELSNLKAILQRFYEGQGRIVSVTGDVGLGKSRLIEELNRICAQDGQAQWVDGRALSFGEEASYLVARDVLRNMLGLELDSSTVAKKTTLYSAVEAILPDQFVDVYPFLAYLLDVPLEDALAQRIKYLEGEALHERIMQAVQTYVTATSRQKPLVMVWEDLHWADPSSLHLLESLLPFTQDHSLLLFLIYRPPLPDSRIAQFQKRLYTAVGDASTIIEVAPLTEAESGQLLDNLLGAETLPKTMKQIMVTKAEGIPFYLEEVIRSLINSGAIARSVDNHHWQVMTGIDDISLPDTLQGVIMSRIDQLDPETKRILQVAAVIGRNFSHQVLTQVVETLQVEN